MGGFAFELDLLASRMSLVDPPRPAIMPPAEEVCVAPEVVGSNGSHGLAVGQCANEPMLTQPLLEVGLFVPCFVCHHLETKEEADLGNEYRANALAFALTASLEILLIRGHGSGN